MLHHDAQTTIDTILTAPRDTLPDLILDMRNRKELSKVVHTLNESVLSGAPDQRARAARALLAMGFVTE